MVGLTAGGLHLFHDGVAYRLRPRLQKAFALLMNRLYALADRLEPEPMRQLNAMVFALVAEKPNR